MKSTVVAKVKSDLEVVEVSFSPEGQDLEEIQNLFSDVCSKEERQNGESKLLKLAEMTAKGLGEVEENCLDLVLVQYRLEK